MLKRTLHGQTAIITGASSGIGRATALALARQGVRIALAARNQATLQQVAHEIEALGSEALVLPTDVTQQKQAQQLVTDTLAHWQQLDIVIANAGLYVRGPVRELTIEPFEQSMAINFYGTLYVILASLPHLLAQNNGHIVYMSTMDARKGIPLDAPYVAAKSAASGFMQVLRQELHDTHIHATTVFPGRVDTPMIDTLSVPWISAKIAPEAVARSTVRAIKRRKPEVIVPLQARAFDLVNLFPRLGDWFTRVLHLEGWEDAT